MSYDTLRRLKTFLQSKGSSLLSVGEQKMRTAMTKMSALYETADVTLDNPPRTVTSVRCVDVAAQLQTILAENVVRGRVHQHRDISGTQLRVSVGGDYGGDYTKLLLSMWDVEQSQSPNNAVFLGMYLEAEKYNIMKAVFGPVLQQLAKLPPPAPPSPPPAASDSSCSSSSSSLSSSSSSAMPPPSNAPAAKEDAKTKTARTQRTSGLILVLM